MPFLLLAEFHRGKCPFYAEPGTLLAVAGDLPCPEVANTTYRSGIITAHPFA